MKSEMLHISFGNGQREVSVRLNECIPCTVGGNSTGVTAELPSESSAEHARNSEPLNRGHDERTATMVPTNIGERNECIESIGRFSNSGTLLSSSSGVEQEVNPKLRAKEVRNEPTSLKNTSQSFILPDAPVSSPSFIANGKSIEVEGTQDKSVGVISSPEKLPGGITFESGKFFVGKTYKGAYRDVGSFVTLSQATVALGIVNASLWKNGKEHSIKHLTVDASFRAIKVLAQAMARDEIAVSAYVKGDQKLFNDRLKEKAAVINESLNGTFSTRGKGAAIANRKRKRYAEMKPQKSRKKQMMDTDLPHQPAVYSDCESVVIKPGTFDVIPGSSRASIKHQGNKYFRKLVCDHFADCDEESRTIVARKIVDNIRSRGGFFLKEISGSEVAWSFLNEDEATEMTEARLCSMSKMMKAKDPSTSHEVAPNSVENVVDDGNKIAETDGEVEDEVGNGIEGKEQINSDIELAPHDIVVAPEGSTLRNHIGNKKFKRLTERCLERYRKAGGQDTAKYILKTIHGRGGRFLQCYTDRESKIKFVEVPDVNAIRIVTTALDQVAMSLKTSKHVHQQHLPQGVPPHPPPPPPPPHFYAGQYNYQAQAQPYYYPPTYPYGYDPRYHGYYYRY